MIPFAVKVEGIGDDEKTARWVLAVDAVGERLLISHGDSSLHWHLMSDCTFVKAATPDNPRFVIPVQPQAGPQLVMPNRAARRALGRSNGL